MMCKRATALVMVAIMAIMPSTWFVNASDDAVGIPITPVSDVTACAFYFADNMVYAPQWRLGNLVRIEVMVVKLADFNADATTNALDIPLEVNCSIETGVMYYQEDLIGEPDLILETYMVSVPEILITIESEDSGPYEFYGLFGEDGYVPEYTGDASGTVGREINKAGHLIYGFLWDTSADGVEAGRYNVSVWLPTGYNISIAMRNYYVTEDIDGDGEQGARVPGPSSDDIPPDYFLELDTVTDPVLTGQGGVDPEVNAAFVNIGEIIEGTGSGTTGDNGGENGGNQHGNLGNRNVHR